MQYIQKPRTVFSDLKFNSISYQQVRRIYNFYSFSFLISVY